jgi:hypothetical protein
MKISDFEDHIEFRSPVGVVYVVFLIVSGKEIPFYIGETGRFTGRMSDYYTASFSAATDFKVGKAVKYLMEKGYRIIVACKKHDDRKVEEDRLVAEARAEKRLLLNDLPGYNYRTADEKQEHEAIQQFCNSLIDKEEALANQRLDIERLDL